MVPNENLFSEFDPDIIANYALPLLCTLVFLLGFFLLKNFALIAYSPKKYFGNPQNILGGFQLEFVSISQVINHMTRYNSSAFIG